MGIRPRQMSQKFSVAIIINFIPYGDMRRLTRILARRHDRCEIMRSHEVAEDSIIIDAE